MRPKRSVCRGGKWRITPAASMRCRAPFCWRARAGKWSARPQRKGGAGRRVNWPRRKVAPEQPYVAPRTAKIHTLITLGVRHHEKPRVSKPRKRLRVGSIPIARSTFRCLTCPCVVLGGGSAYRQFPQPRLCCNRSFDRMRRGERRGEDFGAVTAPLVIGRESDKDRRSQVSTLFGVCFCSVERSNGTDFHPHNVDI